MDKITIGQIKKAAKIAAVSLPEDRLELVTPILNQTLLILEPLKNYDIPKETEPNSFNQHLRRLEKTAKIEDS